MTSTEASPAIDADLIAGLRQCPTATLCDALAKSGLGKPERMVMSGATPVVRPAGPIVGRARTMQMGLVRDPQRSAIVSNRPLAFSLVDGAAAGDFLVVAAPAGPPYAIWGGVLTLRSSLCGCAGAVADGFTRDVGEIVEHGFSVWCKGITPIPAGHGGYSCVAVDVPVTCYGVEVLPEDYLVGDADGLIVLAPELVPDLLEVCNAMVEAEVVAEQRMRNGSSMEEAYPSRAYYANRSPGA